MSRYFIFSNYKIDIQINFTYENKFKHYSNILRLLFCSAKVFMMSSYSISAVIWFSIHNIAKAFNL